MMTRKHYNALANAIKETTETHDLKSDITQDAIKLNLINRDRFIFRLTNILKQDNPNFNEELFVKACNQ